MFEPTTQPPAPDEQTPRERLETVLYELRRVIVGQDRLLDRVLVAVLSRGHVLLEGVPGLAKTLTLETVARVSGGSFARIQFTPDLVPSDVVGGQVLDRQGKPFFVLATQNPLESEGVYALPEAQLDRFAMKILVDYPSQEDEEEIVRRMTSAPPIVRTLLSAEEIVRLQELTDSVFVDHRVRAYAVRLVTATREPAKENLGNLAPYLDLGASPRASLSLIRGAKALAVMRGRNYILPEDVHSLYLDCLRHRVILSYEALAADVRPDQVLNAILDAIPQPQVELGTGRSVA
jgi:MoxR-like ATPase